ncbi:MAG TPA: hypothetical protein VD907_01995 [Verrucomicrobiae bacterium]|nr:hypothetical protein [Verrucomicrobiae bacterium]
MATIGSRAEKRAWTKREMWFWLDQLIGLGLIVAFWWRQIDASLEGRPPLISWMCSAEAAILCFIWLTIEARRVSTGWQRKEMTGLLVQYSAIVAGNTTVVCIQFYQLFVSGGRLKPWDVTVFQIDLIGMYILIVLMTQGKLHPKSPWARCWYTVVLKATPQLVQALWIFNKKGVIDLVGTIFLVLQTLWRWKAPLAAIVRQDVKPITKAQPFPRRQLRTIVQKLRTAPTSVKALMTGSSLDLASTLLVFCAAFGTALHVF